MQSKPNADLGTAQVLIDVVAEFAAQVLERCQDQWNGSPLLVDGIDLATGRPATWEGHVLSNLACQQNFLRTLDGLHALTGDPSYRRTAEEWIGCALETLHEPESDLLYWGGHSSFDLEANRPLIGNHEMKCVYPYYQFLYQVEPDRTRRFVEGMWHKHVRDWSSLLFNRHGEYETWDRASCWQHDYVGGPLPIIDDRMLSFVNTGSDLICAAALLSKLSRRAEPLMWAKRLLGRYDEIRDPSTGLAGYQFNHREVCRVRESFKPPLGERQDVNETTVITNGVIRTRYGRAAATWLNLYEELGAEQGGDFLDVVVRDLNALATYSYDEDDHCFHSVLPDGARLSPSDTLEGVGYCPPQKLEPVPANGLMFLAYARAYRLSRDDRLLRMVHRLAGGGSQTDLPASTPPQSWVNADQDSVCALFGLLELHQATQRQEYLASASALGQRLVAGSLKDGFLTTGTEGKDGHTGIDSALPLALLHLVAALDGRPADLPRFYPNQTYFDPKVVIALRRREAQT